MADAKGLKESRNQAARLSIQSTQAKAVHLRAQAAHLRADADLKEKEAEVLEVDVKEAMKLQAQGDSLRRTQVKNIDSSRAVLYKGSVQEEQEEEPCACPGYIPPGESEADCNDTLRPEPEVMWEETFENSEAVSDNVFDIVRHLLDSDIKGQALIGNLSMKRKMLGNHLTGTIYLKCADYDRLLLEFEWFGYDPVGKNPAYYRFMIPALVDKGITYDPAVFGRSPIREHILERIQGV